MGPGASLSHLDSPLTCCGALGKSLTICPTGMTKAPHLGIL